MSSAVSLSNVDLVLGSGGNKVQVLDGVSLSLREGESVALVGPSGSGKTSLMMLIGGLERVSRGSITVGEHDIGAMGEDVLARFRGQHIGIVFQQFHLIPTMTALQNVMVPLEFSGHGDAEGAARAALERVGLGHRLNHLPGQLSGGEQQRVAIARATVTQPKLLLADEPTGNLDHETGEQVMQLMFAQQREHGATLLLVTHDPELAARCDRQLHLQDGRLV